MQGGRVILDAVVPAGIAMCFPEPDIEVSFDMIGNDEKPDCDLADCGYFAFDGECVWYG